MGVSSGPRINGLTDLAISIDMANAKSYVGSGTAINNQIARTTSELTNKASFYDVYDLQVADYVIPNAPATALPSFTTTNLGTATFDGIGNYLSFAAPTLGTTVSVEIWAKLDSSYSGNMMVGFETYNIWCLNGGLGFNTSNSDLYGISSANVSTLGLVNTWKHYVFEMRTDVSYTNNKIYVDSVNQVLTQQAGSESSANRKFNTTGYGTIAAWTNAQGYEMPMTFGLFRIYNRALTQAEITSNYNANRSRFV
jgi:hypothetical protein